MIGYALRRALQAIPVLLGVSFVVFFLVRMAPGDPARVLLGERARAQELARLRSELGLDRSLVFQYGRFLSQLARGELGKSIRTGEPVVRELARHLPATAELALAAMLLAVLAGVPLGVWAAVRAGSIADYVVMSASLLGVSLPVFWLGYMLILFLGGWVDYAGRIDERLAYDFASDFYLLEALLTLNGTALASALSYIALPASALATIPGAVIARMTRAALVEVLGTGPIRTARAKGLSEGRVVWGHALRLALVPIVTVAGLQGGYLLGGAVLTETVFSWPGLGSYCLLAISNKDYPAIQGVVLLIAGVFVLANLTVDLLYGLLDPRVRSHA